MSNYSTIFRYVLLPALFFLFLASGCVRNTQGTRLFEVTYAPRDLVVLSGVVFPFFGTVSLDPLPTGFDQALMDNNVSANDIDLIGGFRARVTTLDGSDFSEINRIEIRACPRGQTGGCDQLQNVFTWDEAGGGRRQSLDLNPSLINFRELFLGNENFRFEINFYPFPGESISQPIEYRLEWSVQAVGDLD